MINGDLSVRQRARSAPLHYVSGAQSSRDRHELNKGGGFKNGTHPKNDSSTALKYVLLCREGVERRPARTNRTETDVYNGKTIMRRLTWNLAIFRSAWQ